MAQANLNRTPEVIDTSNDCIVIVNMFETIPGGRTLDVTGFTPSVIQAGHIIIEEDATGELKPMPVNTENNAYAALPANHSYKGVLVASILTSQPLASVMVRGTVNEAAVKNLMGYDTPPAAKTSLTLIRFSKD